MTAESTLNKYSSMGQMITTTQSINYVNDLNLFVKVEGDSKENNEVIMENKLLKNEVASLRKRVEEEKENAMKER